MSDRPANAFLLGLSAETFERLRGQLTSHDLVLGAALQDGEAPAEWVYFPETCLLSLISADAGGRRTETMMAGAEGAAGLLEACGSGFNSIACVVQVDGRAWRAPADFCRDLAMSDPSFAAKAWRLIELQFAKSRQSTLCRAMHPVDKRIARWLIESFERSARRNPLPYTQEFLAAMLSVQRTTVSSIAAELQRRGVIQYRRGQLEIDVLKLEALACDCYSAGVIQRRRLNLSPPQP